MQDKNPIANPINWWPVLFLMGMLELVWFLDWNLPVFLGFNHWAANLPARFWSTLTVFGDTVVVFALLLPLIRRDWDTVRAVVLGFLAVVLVLHGLKYFHMYPRPAAVLAPELYNSIGPRYMGRAFPSGHTTTIALFLGVLLLRWGVGPHAPTQQQ